jgi:PKHD-type hydroxylase
LLEYYRLMTPAAAQEIVLAAAEFDWEEGKARTKEATGTIKRNQEIKATDPARKELLSKVQAAFRAHPNLLADHAVKKMLYPKLNRYAPDCGGEYKRHGDAAVMGDARCRIRTDIACTVFLTPRDMYEGGELQIEAPDGGTHGIKGDPGTCVVYPCYMPHRVTPVTAGERVSAITWMESSFRNVEQRHLMRTFLRGLKKMEADEDLRYGELFTTFGCIHSKLQRMWVESE